jgi:predicted transcriptional regulator
MNTKVLIKKTLDSLPENVTMEQVIDRLIFLDKVQKGMDDSENGRVYTDEEVEQILKKWL